MSKRRDLRAVFDAFPLAGLIQLEQGIAAGRLVHGKFADGQGGCLVNLLSQGEIRSRAALLRFCQENRLADEATFKRVIAAWDQHHAINKGVNYAAVYPTPTYNLELDEVRAVLRAAIARRRRVNDAENRAIARMTRRRRCQPAPMKTVGRL